MSRKTITICIAIVTAFLLVLFTADITLRLSEDNTAKAFGLWSNTSSAYEERYTRLDQVYSILTERYYKEVDEETLLLGAIDGMTASLDDPYTMYFTGEEMRELNTTRSGEYVGIGVMVRILDDGYIYIARVFGNSPAQEAGLRKGDIIMASDGLELKAYTSSELTEAVSHIKGLENSYVNLTIKRGEELFDCSVMRAAVVQNRTEYLMLDDKIAYVSLSEFFGTAVQDVKNALDYINENDAQALIFDLRNNTGGLLDQCVDITDMFLPESVIVYTQDRSGEKVYYYSDASSLGLPMAVLVNGNTASASEIFAAAVQDTGVGTIVGTTTFGKGIVQTIYPFNEDGAALQLTTSQYYTPSGRTIHKTGVTPDVEVEYQQNETADPASVFEILPETDNQLKAAYEYLLDELNKAE